MSETLALVSTWVELGMLTLKTCGRPTSLVLHFAREGQGLLQPVTVSLTKTRDLGSAGRCSFVEVAWI